MIGPVNIIINECVFNPSVINHISGDKEVIDTPPDIFLSGIKAITPVRIRFLIRMLAPESVDHAHTEQAVHPVDFILSIPGVW